MQPSLAWVGRQVCGLAASAGSGEIVVDGIILAMNITLLAMQGAFDLGLAAVLDTLETANELAASMDSPPPRLVVSLIGTGRRVHTARGFVVPVRAANSTPRPNAVMLPALGEKTPAALLERLARRDVAKAGGMLREWSQDGAWIGAACTSTFVLADSTLLDGHGATTSWWLAPLFRQRYARVGLDESRMLVASGPFVTAGAALAHVDLALGLVRRHSPGLAALTARYLLVEPRTSQAAFVIPDHLAHSDPLVERFESWARQHIKNGFSLAAAARTVGTSERTLDRRLRAVLGKSPLAYFQDLRVERAVHLLQTSQASVEGIAAEIGYSDGVTLRTLLRRKLGRGVREIRSQKDDKRPTNAQNVAVSETRTSRQ
jgi:transcriptional regulator GlxA family with amidase domain